MATMIQKVLEEEINDTSISLICSKKKHTENIMMSIDSSEAGIASK
jgi:hypothetical protein